MLLINNIAISPIPIVSSTNIDIHNPNSVEAILLKNLLKINFKNIVYKSYNECKVKWNLISDMTSLNENDLIESLIYTSWRIDELLLNCILTDELYFDRRNYFYNNFIINSVRRN